MVTRPLHPIDLEIIAGVLERLCEFEDFLKDNQFPSAYVLHRLARRVMVANTITNR